MTRLSITIDDQLLENAKRITNARTKREAVQRALEDLVRRDAIAGLIALAGSDIIEMTPEELREMRDASLRRIDGK